MVSKRQHTVETNTYGSELAALKIAFEITIEMRYKLRMIGITVDHVRLYKWNTEVCILVPESYYETKFKVRLRWGRNVRRL